MENQNVDYPEATMKRHVFPLSSVPCRDGCHEVALSWGERGGWRRSWWEIRLYTFGPLGSLGEVINSEPSSKGITWAWQCYPLKILPLHSKHSALFANCGNHRTDELCKASWISGSSCAVPPSLLSLPNWLQMDQHFLHSQDSRVKSQWSSFIIPPSASTFQLPKTYCSKGWLHWRMTLTFNLYSKAEKFEKRSRICKDFPKDLFTSDSPCCTRK